MVIILSAIASIDTEIFESAQIDGANGIQTAWYITLPLIKITMLVLWQLYFCSNLCIISFGNRRFTGTYQISDQGKGGMRL